MIQTKTKIHRHELSVALAKVRLFRCYKTHLDSNLYQKKRSRKKEEHKNKEKPKKCNYKFNVVTIREKKNNLHWCHSQHKLHSHSPMKLWSPLNYIN